jgi:serine/threonine-protein kinase
MKRCPECRRDYFDDSLAYCLDDGSALLQGPASMDEPATAMLAAGAAAVRSGETAGASPARSIAVLPFRNISADAENEYFCEGLAEELLNALSKIGGLKVAARTSAFSFKGKQAEAREIGRTLNVDTVLEGSVRKSGDRLRVTVQLVNAADGYQLWSERYDREMKDIFDVQDEIALAVVEALKLKLLGEEKAALLKRHTRSAEAHEFYLRGLSHFARWTPTDFEKSIDNFERAIAIDPAYASAYAGLADAWTELSFFSFSAVDVRPKARKAAETALLLDDGLAEAHNSLALIKMYFDWDYAGAEAEFRRAIALNPGNAAIHMWIGWFLGLMGRFDESLAALRRAKEMDPLSPPNANAIGVVLYWSRQTAAAIEQFTDVLELIPNYPVAVSFLAEAHVLDGNVPAAVATIERIPREAMDPQALSVLGYVYARSGDRGKAQEILDEFARRADREYVPALNFAHIYAGLGDIEQALTSLEKACQERVSWVPFIRVDPKFDVLRTDARFDDLLRKAGFTQ